MKLVMSLLVCCGLLIAAPLPVAASDPAGLFARQPGAAMLVLARDVADSAPRRAQANADHMRYIEGILEHILMAGPMYDPDGVAIVGSVYVLQVDSEARARALVEADPLFAAGVWANVEYRPFLPAAGDWLDGFIWQAREAP